MLKPEVKLVGNVRELLAQVCGNLPPRKLWVLEIGHSGWRIQVAPSRGVDGPPFNMRVVDPAGVEQKISYWIPSAEEAVRKAANTMVLAGAKVNRQELAQIARRYDRIPEPT